MGTQNIHLCKLIESLDVFTKFVQLTMVYHLYWYISKQSFEFKFLLNLGFIAMASTDCDLYCAC